MSTQLRLKRFGPGEYQDFDLGVVITRIEDGLWHLIHDRSWVTTVTTKREAVAEFYRYYEARSAGSSHTGGNK